MTDQTRAVPGHGEPVDREFVFEARGRHLVETVFAEAGLPVARWRAVPFDAPLALGQHGGHATLIRAPDAVRAAVPVFQPLSDPLMRVTLGIKAAHDPAGVFNPGRMYAGV